MFNFASKDYNSIEELRVTKLSATSDYSVWRDVHGRKVVHYYERYPCFDSSDFLYEDRGYHYFYTLQGDDLVCLYYDDGEDTLRLYDSDHMPVKVFRTILQNELQSDSEDQQFAIPEPPPPDVTDLPKEKGKYHEALEAALDVLISLVVIVIIYMIFS